MKNYFKLAFVVFLLVSCAKDPAQYSLNISVQPENGGVVTPSSGIYEEGTPVTISVTPSEYYLFKQCKGDINNTSQSFTIKMNSNKTIIVVFEKDTDGDGVADSRDKDNNTPKGEEVDEDGLSDSQRDSDGDGVTDDKDLEPDTPEEVEVDEDGRGLKTYVPDDNFEQFLIDYGPDDVLDNYVYTTYLGGLAFIDISGKGIKDLTGIEDFVNLTGLVCGDNPFTELDISKNIALTSLSCNNSQLTSLDVTNNTALTSLSCNNNQFTSLDITNNIALIDLLCYDNQLTSLDLSKNTALKRLTCFNNQLTSLEVNNNTSLNYLRCYSNQLTELDVSNNTELVYIYCDENQLTSLDVSKNIALVKLCCDKNNLTSIGVSQDQLDNKTSSWIKDDSAVWEVVSEE